MLENASNPQGIPPAGPATPIRILVVEDDFVIRMTLGEMLMDEGFEIVEAGSGDEAAALIDAAITLVITDIQLPGLLDGPALVRQARLTRPLLPVIYTSGRLDGHPLPGEWDMAVAKPYDGATISRAVHQMLAKINTLPQEPGTS